MTIYINKIKYELRQDPILTDGAIILPMADGTNKTIPTSSILSVLPHDAAGVAFEIIDKLTNTW